MRLKQLLFNTATPWRDTGILIRRIGYGIIFIGHGFPKLDGGPDTWAMYGETMRNVGIYSVPLFWGFMAGLAEFGGGVLFMLGLLFRPVCGLLLLTMTFATINHLTQGDWFIPVSHPVEVGLVFLAFLFIGPGPYSLDATIRTGKHPGSGLSKS